jgi:hypothetical protein
LDRRFDMANHFEFTGETTTFDGVTLRRIRATRDIPEYAVAVGDLGGWIEREENLSDSGWVDGEAKVYGDARVFGNALVSGSAQVFGDARVFGYAQVFGYARVFGSAQVFGNARVYNSTIEPSIVDRIYETPGAQLSEKDCRKTAVSSFVENIVKSMIHGSDAPLAKLSVEFTDGTKITVDLPKRSKRAAD